MELFHEDGHLTGAGLRALADGGLDELGRLEAAEHLSFCDSCLVRYTALLADDALLKPETPLKPGVMKRLRTRGWRVAAGRYATVAAAACLAVVMWAVGSFALPRSGWGGAAQAFDTASAGAAGQEAAGDESAAQKLDRFLDNTLAGVNGFLDRLSLAPAGAAEREKQREEERRQAERKQKEQVFNQRAGAQPDDADDADG